MKHFARSICFTAAALAVLGAQAATVSGSANGLTWEASSTIIGQASTGTIASGGSAIYLAPMPKYSGVVQLLMQFTNGGFVCSGSLLSDRVSVLTAAHCLNSTAQKGTLVSTTALFYDGTNGDTILLGNPRPAGVMSYTASSTTMHPLYTGQVIDENDIAVVTLNGYVDKKFSTYELYAGGSLTGVDFNVAGYGTRSTGGGAVGDNGSAGVGRLRQGDNRYDFAFGDSDFGGFWADFWDRPATPTTPAINGAANANVWLSDFDNGLAANDASCRLTVDGLGFAASGKYCNTGRGALEVSVAGGDSGGPQFVNGQIASVTSFGLTFRGLGDIRAGLQSSFGEFNGFVPVSIHKDFIESLRVPEPGSLALVGLAGFMMVAARRRKAKADSQAV